MKVEELEQIKSIIKDLPENERNKIVKLDHHLRDKLFRENFKEYPVETLRKKGFDVPKGTKFTFIEDETKVMEKNGRNGTYYICLKHYESGYVDTEEFKNVAAGLSTGAITAIAVGATTAVVATIGAGLYFGFKKPSQNMNKSYVKVGEAKIHKN